MGRNSGSKSKLQANMAFSEIIKRAYEKGISDRTITVVQLIEEIKADLIKMKVG